MIALLLLLWGTTPVVLDVEGDRLLLGWPEPVVADADPALRMRLTLVVAGRPVAGPVEGVVEQARLLPGGRAVVIDAAGALLVVEGGGARTLDTGVTGAVGASPDGRFLVYAKGGLAEQEIWTLEVGGPPRALTNGMAPAWSPAISADGRTVVFASSRSGVPGLWLVEDGGTPRQITNIGRPDPSRLTPFPTSLSPTLLFGGRVFFESRGRVHEVALDGGLAGSRPGRAPHLRSDGMVGVVP